MRKESKKPPKETLQKKKENELEKKSEETKQKKEQDPKRLWKPNLSSLEKRIVK